MVDQRTIEKYKRGMANTYIHLSFTNQLEEAKDAGRETWYLSWALDLTKEERAKGKTVEVGRAFFETERRRQVAFQSSLSSLTCARYSILDAPGHRTFTPQAITGAAQADVGVLVISARRGEYETGFERAGQTREHAVLAKTQGVNKVRIEGLKTSEKPDELTTFS
jgi:peptide chain release factor subunit 3